MPYVFHTITYYNIYLSPDHFYNIPSSRFKTNTSGAIPQIVLLALLLAIEIILG